MCRLALSRPDSLEPVAEHAANAIVSASAVTSASTAFLGRRGGRHRLDFLDGGITDRPPDVCRAAAHLWRRGGSRAFYQTVGRLASAPRACKVGSSATSVGHQGRPSARARAEAELGSRRHERAHRVGVAARRARSHGALPRSATAGSGPATRLSASPVPAPPRVPHPARAGTPSTAPSPWPTGTGGTRQHAAPTGTPPRGARSRPPHPSRPQPTSDWHAPSPPACTNAAEFAVYPWPARWSAKPRANLAPTARAAGAAHSSRWGLRGEAADTRTLAPLFSCRPRRRSVGRRCRRSGGQTSMVMRESEWPMNCCTRSGGHRRPSIPPVSRARMQELRRSRNCRSGMPRACTAGSQRFLR